MQIDFERHRPYLFSVAYRMTGSAADAEDLVQEAYLRASDAGRDDIENPRAWLATIVTRLSLDLLKSARKKREEYVGPWLPEPLMTAEQETADPDTISFAFLLLLERLTPEERAVLILREVFHYEFDEIADVVDKEAANCRQILHRARKRVEQDKPRFRASKDEHRRLVDGFMASIRSGDSARLESLLAPDVTSWSDGGGKVNAARRPIEGRENVLRFLVGLQRLAPADYEMEAVEINGSPGIATFVAGELFNTISIEVGDGKIQRLQFVVNPDKLGFLRDQLSRE